MNIEVPQKQGHRTVMSRKILNQNEQSRQRTEELCRIVDDEYSIDLSLKNAEALQTRTRLTLSKQQGVFALLDDDDRDNSTKGEE
jgi:hypothetical protein